MSWSQEQKGRDSRRKEDLAFSSLHTLATCSGSFRDILGLICISEQKENKKRKIKYNKIKYKNKIK